MKQRVLDQLGSTGRLSLASWRGTRSIAALLTVVASLGLAGCGPRRMRVDFTNFEKVYAATSNQEVLLNLARLTQHEPTYFFKLGQISSSYRMSASLSTNGAYVIQGTTPGGGNATGGGTPGLVYENDPSFTFIPVNDETNAQLLLRPVPAEVFYNLYQQGARVDQMLRLLVDRIELTLSTPQGCYVETIRNVPPPVYHGQVDQRSLNRYVTFLRVSAVVYALQRHGFLLLGGSSKFSLLNKNGGLDPGKTSPLGKDIIDAAAANEEWQLQDGKWVLGKNTAQTSFYLSTIPAEGGADTNSVSAHEASVNFIADQLKQDFPTDSTGLPDQDLKNILEVLYAGFSIEGSSTDSEDKGSCTSSGSYGIFSHLVMRSLLGVMAAAAQEQAPFDALKKNNDIHLAPDSMITSIQTILLKAAQAKASPGQAGGTSQTTPTDQIQPAVLASSSAGLTFSQAVPVIERQPVLQLSWPPDLPKTDPYVKVIFGRNDFEIADRANLESTPETEYAEENEYWNRDTFRLICELSSQVTVDISKFPLPEVLQLRTE